jgi:hypothetical protein
MLAAIVAWWKSHSLTTHSLMVAVATLTTLYAAVPAFQSLLNQLYSMTPAWFHEIFMAAIGIYTYYSVANKPAPPAPPTP